MEHLEAARAKEDPAVNSSTRAAERRRLLLAGSAVALAAFAGVALAQAPAPYTVTMANMSYGQLPKGLKVGDTVTFVNRDTVPHTVTARDRSFDLRLAAGKSASLTLHKAGAFAFYCTYHPMMRGTLSVAAA
jgi:plastocyanin